MKNTEEDMKNQTETLYSPAFFRKRRINDKWLLTDQAGGFTFLDDEEMDLFQSRRISPDSGLFSRLNNLNLFRENMRIDEMAGKLRERQSFLGHGPSLHVVVVTLRCNASCVYCQASRAPMSATETDMSIETADRVIDAIFSSTSPFITIEFQGGEPLVNFPLIQQMVKKALEKNRSAGKKLEFNLVSNLLLMDNDKLEWLLDNRVQICTSIDGPPELHDRQRRFSEGSNFETTAEWIRRINNAYEEMKLDPVLYRVEALMTATREALAIPREIVNTYLELGCRALFLRPLSPLGFAGSTRESISFSAAEYLEFYRTAVDYMIEVNIDGREILERYAAIFIMKILGGKDPNFLDIRSPCGAVIGQIAYHHDGSIFPCDEGRMVHSMGDDFFRLGSVHDFNYREIIGHETTRAMLSASILDGAPDCISCAYAPYCGVCPVHNYCTQGSLHGRARDNRMCAIFKGIQDYLFEKISQGDKKTLEVLERWSQARPMNHFVHD